MVLLGVVETLLPPPPRRDKATVVRSSNAFRVLGRTLANEDGMDLEWQIARERSISVSRKRDFVIFPAILILALWI